MSSQFLDELNSILSDLQKYKRPKSELMSYYIETRLQKSLETYYKELSESASYLQRQDALNVNRKMMRADREESEEEEIDDLQFN